MQQNLLDKYLKMSRIIVIILVFIVLNVCFLYENDPHWILSIITSIIVFFISCSCSKICKFLINKGNKIKSSIIKLSYYVIALPIIFLFFLFMGGLFYTLVVAFLDYKNLLNLDLAFWLLFVGIIILVCFLVLYVQTLIILILRYFLKFYDNKK